MDLIQKVKQGIAKSGFPLEMKIGNILADNDWMYSIGNIYEDFKTGKFRESDVSANKTINGISVHLFIECKKSEEKQIVLYAPKKTKFLPFSQMWLKSFPNVTSDD